MARRLWAIGLLLYALIAAADMGHHLYRTAHAGGAWYAPPNLVVAFSAGLFWPGDLVAHFLLSP
ncbi:MAG: hypothetical protein JO008_05475 [Alphaproteobacteria bacterium]|nr:hypothetical protein [Alphaproteobacteria bacterium]